MSGYRQRSLTLLASVFLLIGCATKTPAPGSFSFALMGDQQYNQHEEALFPRLIEAIDAEPVAFVVHVGDFKAGSNAPCTNALFERRRSEFNLSRHAFIYTPGDNEWVDCRRPTNGHADPLERLQKLRDIFFATPRSLGRDAIPLRRQADLFAVDPIFSRYRENAMWIDHGVVFATFNIQGSNDNLGFDSASDREHAERTHANIEWLKYVASEAAASDIVALAIFMQANPGFEETPEYVANSGYREFLEAFESAARQLGKPVLFAHGDTHQFRVNHPYLSPLDKRPIANVTRVETYGSPFVNWVRITVDPTNRTSLFGVKSGQFSPTSATN